MTNQMPFLELMKLPVNIGNAVVEGGAAGLKGVDPLMATAKKLEIALKKPLGMFPGAPMTEGGQLPKLPGMEQITNLPAQILKAPFPLNIGKEYVGSPSNVSSHGDVMTTIF